MRKLALGEILTLRELLQMESNALAASKATVMLITDPQLKGLVESGILASEARIKGMQQFIEENDVISTQEVH
jgi:hypothetical protein